MAIASELYRWGPSKLKSELRLLKKIHIVALHIYKIKNAPPERIFPHYVWGNHPPTKVCLRGTPWVHLMSTL